MSLSQKLIKDCKKLKKLNLILSGGNSPLKDYKNLFKAKLNWKDIDLYLSDERLVKTSNKQSNFFNINKILKENNLEKKLKPINKIFLQKKKIMKILNNIKKKPTIAVLGMGEDGHFGSIFLKSKKYKLLTDTSKSPYIYKTEPLGSPKVERVTMNLSMFLLSSKIYLILNNKKKINLYKKANISLNTRTIPISSLIKASKKITIIKNLSDK